MEDFVAERAGFGFGEAAGEADSFRPGDQQQGEECDVEPGVIGGVVPEGKFAGAGVFPDADTVLDSGVLTVS